MRKNKLNPVLFTSTSKYSEQKLRGGYYTPEKITNFLVEWAYRNKKELILEPGCGDGSFVEALLKNVAKSKNPKTFELTAIEINKTEIDKAIIRSKGYKNSANINWLNNDFFHIYDYLKKRPKFDTVLGNPPFIRFQNFEKKSQEEAFKHLRAAGYKPTKLSNAWAAFIQLSIELLKPGGKLGMVVPAELLQVGYAAELRNRLSHSFDHVVIIGFRKLVFDGILQEIILLLAEGKREASNSISDIHTIELNSLDQLAEPRKIRNYIVHQPAKHTRNGIKWTALFLKNKTFSALDKAEKSEGLTKLGTLVDVNVGVVTGNNNFFVLDGNAKDRISANGYVHPLIGKTSAIPSLLFNQNDFEEYAKKHPAYLLNLSGVASHEIPKQMLDYFALGEEMGIHQGYKCRIRNIWYEVPSIYIPDAFLYRQIHKFPLLVVNIARVTSTDTIHRVRLKQKINISQLAAASFNSLTLAWAEVCGRSYGGGVLELEPSEALELPIPFNEKVKLNVKHVDGLLRAGEHEEALDYVDGILLRDYLGFKPSFISDIRSAWYELRDRRLSRN